MSEQPNIKRRNFLRQASAAVAAIPVVSVVGMSAAKASAALAEDGHAHNYVNNAADADHPDHKAGQMCQNCAFWGGGDAEQGQCYHADFQGVHVSASGWCKEFVSG
ncbi:MAG: high-potential iron-sulfur protein [Thioalkalivibrio sp.]|jgi:hypothetical protein|nr:high-potential iron-sulfur protein [Thioalkalivibrio sp.]